jgi:DNA-3-methyladenine glycosylase
VDRKDNGRDLCDPASELRLEIGADDEPLPVAAGPRIGIDYAPEPWLSRPWRFFVPGNDSLSIVEGRDRPGLAS